MTTRTLSYFFFPLLGLAPLASGQTPLGTVRVASNLSQPLDAGAPPGDFERLFIAEQGGRIKILNGGVVLATPFLNIAGLILTGSERGLLGLAFHPNYASNGFFFVNYTRAGDGATVVARYQVSAGNPDLANAASGQVLLTVQQPFSNHNAGCLRFGPDGYLYVAMGDGGSGNDPFGNGQNTGTLLGKMLRIDVDGGPPYGIPPTNPFVGPGNPLDEIWAIGLRNPWRFGFDRLTGDLYIGDVGQDAREEIDFEPAGSPGGRNFGWRCMEGKLCTGFSGCTCNSPALTLPIHDYVNPTQGCAVTGGYVYRGCAIPDLRGTYFFADFCSARIWSFRYDGTTVTNFTDRTTELAPGGGVFVNAISSFGEDGHGELFICDLGGEVFKIVPEARPANSGLLAYGAGTPGCSGAHSIGANCPPTIANPGWRITATNAPPSASGLVVLSDTKVAPGSDPFGMAVNFLVGVLPPSVFFTVPMASNAAGLGTSAIPIPNQTALVGTTLVAQAFWFWAGPCNPSPLGVSSSNGLSITLLP